MHRPKDVTQRLGVSQTTLRRWAAQFADYLSPTAGSAIAETGGPAQRRFTDQDVALLAAIQRELAGGRTVDEVLVRLQRGDIRPDVVAAHDNMLPGAETNQRALTEPPMDGSADAVALVGGSPAELQQALVQLLQSAPLVAEVLAEVNASLATLHESQQTHQASIDAQREVLQEMRAEREALAAELVQLQDHLQAIRDSPLVPNVDHGGPQAPMTGWQRVKRLFTGQP